MGYVDSDTLIKLRDKMLRRTAKDKKVCTRCLFGTDLEGDGTLGASWWFESEYVYEPGAKYSIAIGQKHGKGHYFYEGNGNGFIADDNDYLHQRKRYLPFEFDTSRSKTMTMRDLLDFLFGEWLTDHLISDGYEAYKKHTFPALGREANSVLFVFDISLDSLWQSISAPGLGAYITQLKKTFLKRTEEEGLTGFGYRGRIYVVKNAFTRPQYQGKFCERVIAYCHLIVSANKDPDDPSKTRVWISRLPVKNGAK